MDWTQDRAALGASYDYSFDASPELITGICLIGHFVEALTCDDICNSQLELEFRNGTFAMRSSCDGQAPLPNFSFGAPGTEEAFDVTWYKEAGWNTTVSRQVDVEEIVEAVGACLASLSVELPEFLYTLWVFGRDNYAGADFVERLLKAGQKAAA